ncbi:MAG: FAD-dependent oxidoreductase, partial [Clostridiales Family XIII bacterium]|nr:FAD-dependent oxidoreductase [Clostridiales Family XIII bacterium]
MGVNRKNADADRESMDTNEEKKASSDEVMREKPRSYTPRESLWTATCQIDKREALQVEESIEVEAVVIGAGLAGVLTAYMLQQKGVDTIVLESNRIGSGVTRYTTAKITSQHNLIYDRLISDFGMEKARQYAVANQRAIDFFRKFVQEKAIDCQLEDKPAYLYTLQKDKVKQLEKESEAATKLGIPNAVLQSWEMTAENGWGLPFIAEAAL